MKNLLFSVSTILLFFGVLELTLSLQGFNYSHFPRVVKHSYNKLQIDYWEKEKKIHRIIPHKSRLWAAKPGEFNANSKGYMGEEVSVERNYSVKRILFLGDSCSVLKISYPDKSVGILNEKYGIQAESIIAAVAGYSSYQGMLFMEESMKYKPDVIVSYFGWNDHWLAQGGGPDNEFKSLNFFELKTFNMFSNFRSYQLLHYFIYPPKRNSLGGTGKPGEMDLTGLVRVPPEYYVENLVRMIEKANMNKINIYFIKAPIGPHIIETDRDYLFPTQQIPHIHKLYNALLAETVSQFPNAYLVSFSNTIFDKTLMFQDGIHPNDKGHQVIAEALTAKIMGTNGL